MSANAWWYSYFTVTGLSHVREAEGKRRSRQTCENARRRFRHVSPVLVWYPDDGRLRLVAAVEVVRELRAGLRFDWLVQVAAVTCGGIRIVGQDFSSFCFYYLLFVF